METKNEWCPYEVNHFEKNGICNLCGHPKSEHVTKREYNKSKGEGNKMATIDKKIDEFQDKYKIEVNDRQRKEILELLSKYKKGSVRKGNLFQFFALYLIKDTGKELVKDIERYEMPNKKHGMVKLGVRLYCLWHGHHLRADNTRLPKGVMRCTRCGKLFEVHKCVIR